MESPPNFSRSASARTKHNMLSAMMDAAGTAHDNFVASTVCFDVLNVYEETCLVGGIMCEQSCAEENLNYEGVITITEAESGEAGEGVGSSTSLGASVPLTLQVACSPSSRDWTLIYIIIVVIALIVVGIIFFRRLHKHKEENLMMQQQNVLKGRNNVPQQDMSKGKNNKL